MLPGQGSVNCMKPFPQTSSQDVVLRVMKFGALHFPDVVVTDGTTGRQNGVLSGAAGSNGIADFLRLSFFLKHARLHLRVL